MTFLTHPVETLSSSLGSEGLALDFSKGYAAVASARARGPGGVNPRPIWCLGLRGAAAPLAQALRSTGTERSVGARELGRDRLDLSDDPLQTRAEGRTLPCTWVGRVLALEGV